MNDADGYRLEAALAFGAVIDDDAEQYTFTTSQVIAFAKSCECAGLSKSLSLNKQAVKSAVAAYAAELTPMLTRKKRDS